MKRSVVRTLVAAGLSAAVLFGAAFSAPAWTSLASVVHAQDATQATPAASLPRTITVVGDGVVSIKPDVARANIGVEVLDPSVEVAAAKNNETTAKVLAALKEMGIDEKDIQTSGYSVYSERYNNDGSASDKIQYRVTNTVTVLIRDLTKVGSVLETSIKVGANNIYGVEFLLDDPTAARSSARELAVKNAQATAEELAKLTNTKVGKIISISEVIGNTGGVYSNQFAQAAVGMGGGAAPVEPGQLRLTLQLQVTYELTE